MKTPYGICLLIAAVFGTLFAGVWLHFFFDFKPGKLDDALGLMTWIGAARLLFAAVVATGVYLGFRLLLAIKRNSRGLRTLLLFFARHERKSAGGKFPPIGILAISIIGGFVLLFVLIPSAFHLVVAVVYPTLITAEIVGEVATSDGIIEYLWIYSKGFLIPYALLVSPYLWVVVTERLSEDPLFRRLFIHGRGGSARWAGDLSFSTRATAGAGNLFVGRSTFWDAGMAHGKNIGMGDDAHMLTIGCTGSGKSVTAIWPVLAMYEGSIIILDPKGEHAKMTYWRRNSAESAAGKFIFTEFHLPGNGDKAYKLDPFNQEESIPPSYYNPLSEIDIDDDRVLEKLAAISDGCVLPEGDKNQHWVEGSRTILEGVMAHVLSREPKENQNLTYVHDQLASSERLAALLAEMEVNPAAGGICFKAANLVIQDTKGAMMTTVLRSIKWIGDPAMRRHLAADSSFRFADIPCFEGTARTVYVVAPIGPLMKEQVRWLRVLTNLSITIIRLCAKPKRRTLFILDEFPQLQGKLTAVEEGIVTLRSAHVRLWPFIQQIGQLKKDYGANWNTFISSSNVQTFGITDPETAQWLSESMLGGASILRAEGRRFVSDGPRPLLTAREIMTELGKNEPRSIVFPNDGGFPMRLERLAFKPLVIEGKEFGGLLLEGCFEEPEKGR